MTEKMYSDFEYSYSTANSRTKTTNTYQIVIMKPKNLEKGTTRVQLIVVACKSTTSICSNKC